MSVRRIAMLSMHTSPLAQPGLGDGGGMNVYVRSLAEGLARAGVECDVFTRAEAPGASAAVVVEPGFRVLHVPAGPARPMPKAQLPGLVDEMVEATGARMAGTGYDALHANYWLSGAVAHRLKHELDLPLVATFHTLARVKARAGVDDDDAMRARVEDEVIRCCDRVLASTDDERDDLVLGYGADPDRIEVIAPGVDHTVFAPGDRVEARRRLRLGPEPVLLFVGRIQPLKGADLAIATLAEVPDPAARLLLVGGPSGPHGEAELGRLRALARMLGVHDRVDFVPPVPHGALADFYRAADCCLVPSRTESFGLVALEAAACGTPLVAADVGGLRSLVDDGHTGFLVRGRDSQEWGDRVARLIADRRLHDEMGESAAARSGRYTWSIAAARLRRVYADLTVRALVQCS